MGAKQKEHILNKPEKVILALKLLYVSLGILFLETIVQIVQSPKSSRLLFGVISLLSIGLVWLLFYMIGKGKNWARIVVVAMVILGTPIVLPLFLNLFTNPLQSLTSITQTAIQITASVLLFHKSSSHWFKERKAK